jgi:hypothetical protein
MFLFSYSNPVCLHAARIVVLGIAASYARKSLKIWSTCMGNVSSRIWYFWIAWQGRIIIRPELEIYATYAAGTWEQEPHAVLTSLTLNSTCELDNCRKTKWLVFCHNQVIINLLQPPELELYQHNFQISRHSHTAKGESRSEDRFRQESDA